MCEPPRGMPTAPERAYAPTGGGLVPLTLPVRRERVVRAGPPCVLPAPIEGKGGYMRQKSKHSTN